jgi:pimeloyl-ACP methyl ester carboxylesterase
MANTEFPRLRTGAIGASAVVAPLAAGIAYSALAINHAVPLAPAIEAERRTLRTAQAGQVTYYADEHAAGRPLLLVHSINAAASAYEMRPLFEHYRRQRPVYALDLPGFGFSERADRVYTPALYTAVVLDVLRQITSGREAVDIIALSLGSEFAARVALEQPSLVRSLTLISPSGLTARMQRNRSERAGASPMGAVLNRTLRFPLWSQAFYDLVASKPSIRYFLQMSFVGKPDAGLVTYAYATSHQPGARFAPLAFLSGQLFSPNIRKEVYERLGRPALVLYDQDAFVRFDTLPDLLARNPRWRAVRIRPSKGLPQFEQLEAVTHALDTFWQEIGASRAEEITRR